MTSLYTSWVFILEYRRLREKDKNRLVINRKVELAHVNGLALSENVGGSMRMGVHPNNVLFKWRYLVHAIAVRLEIWEIDYQISTGSLPICLQFSYQIVILQTSLGKRMEEKLLHELEAESVTSIRRQRLQRLGVLFHEDSYIHLSRGSLKLLGVRVQKPIAGSAQQNLLLRKLEALRTKKLLELSFLSSTNMFDVKKRSLAGRSTRNLIQLDMVDSNGIQKELTAEPYEGDSEIAEAWFDQAAEYWKQAIALTPGNYIEALNWLKITRRFE
ncbi:hypothetical protein Tco_0410780 [Tanacetum coccineum]